MTKTCKEATIPDTAIIHPVLAWRLTSVSVLKDGWLDSHDPVIFKLQMPGQQIFRLGCKLPDAWANLALTPQVF